MQKRIEEITQKREALQSYMEKIAREDMMVAFSGGVDSSLLLYAACKAAEKTGCRVYAVTVHTQLHPAGDCEAAARVAASLGAEHILLELDELEDAGIGENPVNRCYLCKKFLFSRILEEAGRRKAGTILEGTNVEDLLVYRPGIRAVRELGIASPLAELGITKEQVRLLAREYGISVSDRPSSPCLATRFPYGTHLSYEEMKRVDEGENWLRSLGFYNVRLRVHDRIIRLEVDRRDMAEVIQAAGQITEYIKGLGYDYVTLDLDGFRSGSMDIHVQE